jgi:hypothetical protein
MMLWPWNSRGNMGEDQIVPTVKRNQAIAGREIDADGGLNIGNRVDMSVHLLPPLALSVECAANST